MTDMDYSKTRIFERHTNLETTNKKNAELKEMYQTTDWWKEVINSIKGSE